MRCRRRSLTETSKLGTFRRRRRRWAARPLASQINGEWLETLLDFRTPCRCRGPTAVRSSVKHRCSVSARMESARSGTVRTRTNGPYQPRGPEQSEPRVRRPRTRRPNSLATVINILGVTEPSFAGHTPPRVDAWAVPRQPPLYSSVRQVPCSSLFGGHTGAARRAAARRTRRFRRHRP